MDTLKTPADGSAAKPSVATAPAKPFGSTADNPKNGDHEDWTRWREEKGVEPGTKEHQLHHPV